MSTSESIEWIAPKDGRPDVDETVLVCATDRRVWLGWYADGHWFAVDSAEYDDGQVIAWARIPKGPV